MSKEKLVKVTKYAELVKSKLSSPLPEKHKAHPEQYKNFLEKELKAANSKIESLKLSVDKK